MRNALRSLRSDERGITLVLVLGTIMILSILVVSVIGYASTNSRQSSLSSHRQRAYTLAEAGLNDAMSVLFASSTPAFPGLLPSRTTNYDGGSVTWSGTLDQSIPQTACPGATACWVITSIGRMRNPAGGSLPQTRKLTIKIPLTPVYEQPLVNDAYDYVFVYHGAPSVCDFNGANISSFTSPLYFQGNLCSLTARSHRLYPLLGADREHPQTGRHFSARHEGVHVANGCRYTTSLHSPCTGTDHVWRPRGRPRDSLTPPTIADGLLQEASPGPYAAARRRAAGRHTSNWQPRSTEPGSTIDVTR